MFQLYSLGSAATRAMDGRLRPKYKAGLHFRATIVKDVLT